MSKYPLKQTTPNAFFPPKVEQPDEDDDVVVVSAIKRGTIVISDSEEEALPQKTVKRARANRLLVADTDDENQKPADETSGDGLSVGESLAKPVKHREALAKPAPPGRVEEAPLSSTKITSTADSYVRKGGEVFKTISRATTGDIHQVQYRLQSRQPADESTITTMLERATTLLRDSVAGGIDLGVAHWQKSIDLPTHFDTIKKGSTPFLQEALRLIDAGNMTRFKQATFRQKWAKNMGCQGVDLTDIPDARRQLLAQALKAAETSGILHPTVYMATGFDTNGDMKTIYIGKTVNHTCRSTEHHSRVLGSTPAEKEESMLYAFAKACSFFIVLPAVEFLDDEFKPSQATAEGLLCLLFGRCQLFKTVLHDRAKAGLVDLGADVQGGYSTLAFKRPSDYKGNESDDPDCPKLQMIHRLHHRPRSCEWTSHHALRARNEPLTISWTSSAPPKHSTRPTIAFVTGATVRSRHVYSWPRAKIADSRSSPAPLASVEKWGPNGC